MSPFRVGGLRKMAHVPRSQQTAQRYPPVPVDKRGDEAGGTDQGSVEKVRIGRPRPRLTHRTRAVNRLAAVGRALRVEDRESNVTTRYRCHRSGTPSGSPRGSRLLLARTASRGLESCCILY